MRGHRFSPYWLDIITLLLLFHIALAIRITYQNEAIIDRPLRADAREYFIAALNLHRLKAHSTVSSPPLTNITPRPDLHRAPGYPLFLYPFVATSHSLEQFVARVTIAQAIIGSLTAIATYLLGRLFFAHPWACMTGLLAALSPHLVAIDHFILSESIFTFIMVFAALVFVVSWRKKKITMSVLAGLLFGLSVLVRPITLLLTPLMGTLYFFQGRKWAVAAKSVLITQLIFFFMGCALVYGPYLVIRHELVTRSFAASSHTIWEQFVRGADVNLANFMGSKIDPLLRAKTERMIRDKSYGFQVLKDRFLANPFSHLTWYLGGKILFMWRWDNLYNGDVYQYPMVQRGFHTHTTLHAVHTVMRLLHWPLYSLTLLVPLLLLISRRLHTLEPETVVFLVPLSIFMYFAALLTLLMPLPRYAIPLRSFSYILAICGLKQMLLSGRWVIQNRGNISDWFKNPKQLLPSKSMTHE